MQKEDGAGKRKSAKRQKEKEKSGRGQKHGKKSGVLAGGLCFFLPCVHLPQRFKKNSYLLYFILFLFLFLRRFLGVS
jgi:hypothetical protein